MPPDFVVVSTPETTTVVSTGAMGPQGQPGDNDSPSFTGPVLFTLSPSENVLLDARTNHRGVTIGVFRIEHTAGIAGTRPISLDIDANGFGDTHGISTFFKAGSMLEGQECHIIDITADIDGSVGGVVQGIAVSKSGTGSAKVLAVEAYPGVHVVEQGYGAHVVADSNFTFSAGAYTEQTANFDNGVDAPIFVANTDYIYIGHSTKFQLIDVTLGTVASGAGIIPTFEYSNGVNSWATFGPVDGTNGFRQNGNIAIPGLINWVTRTVNGVASKFWVRIRRTNSATITIPVENTIHITVTEIYSWNDTGHLHISNISLKNIQTFTSVANAITGGLVSGDVFRDTNGALFIV